MRNRAAVSVTTPFYHSLETASFAATISRDQSGSDLEVLSAFVAGLMHDSAKVLTLFQVSKFDPAKEQDAGFGGSIPATDDAIIWNPDTDDLWTWSQKCGADYVALNFAGRPPGGHASLIWQMLDKCFPYSILEHVEVDAELFHDLCFFLRHGYSDGRLGSIVKRADNKSIERDISPPRRLEPKRSDLFLIKRFVEFAGSSCWNHPDSAFVNAHVLIDGQLTPELVPFFRASDYQIAMFHNFVYSQDMYGFAFRRDFKSATLDTLESRAILAPSAVKKNRTGLKIDHTAQYLSLNAELQFLADPSELLNTEPLVYFPLAKRWNIKDDNVVYAEIL